MGLIECGAIRFLADKNRFFAIATQGVAKVAQSVSISAVLRSQEWLSAAVLTLIDRLLRQHLY